MQAGASGLLSENLPNETSLALQGVLFTMTCLINPDKYWNSGEFSFFLLIICLFLEQVATQCIKKRLENPDDTTADLDEAREPDEACEPDPSFDPEQNTSAVLAPW